MIRIVVVSLLLIAVPFLVYLIYELARRGPDGQGARHPRDWEKDSVLNMGFAGLGLAALGMVFVLAFGGGSADGTYTPARIENGKLIDGGFNLPEEPSDEGEVSE